MREGASMRAGDRVSFFQARCPDGEGSKAILPEGAGHSVVRVFQAMPCPSLDELPDYRLPQGSEAGLRKAFDPLCPRLS